MALASDLPPLEDAPRHAARRCCSTSAGDEIGTLTGNERRIYLREDQIAPVMKHAIIAIEDRRFYTNYGVDVRGIARAAVQRHGRRPAVQGASTIPQQFVKISLAAENERTVVPEAARGGARLPAHAPVVEGADPAQLPELDLLRQRRLRDRVGRAHVLRLQPRQVRRGTADVRVGAAPARGGAAGRRSWPRRARTTRSSIPSPRRSAATSCCCACSSRGTSRATSTRAARPRPSRRGTT